VIFFACLILNEAIRIYKTKMNFELFSGDRLILTDDLFFLKS